MCLVPKPGMALHNNHDFSFMLEQVLKGKNAIVNLVVTGIVKNSDDEESGTGKTLKQKVCADHIIIRFSAEKDLS